MRTPKIGDVVAFFHHPDPEVGAPVALPADVLEVHPGDLLDLAVHACDVVTLHKRRVEMAPGAPIAGRWAFRDELDR